MNIYYLVRKLDMTLQIKNDKINQNIFSYLLWKENNTDADGMPHIYYCKQNIFF